ncbi:ATP-binding cassette domain-containing protein [Succinispira mobilis]|uniref:ABC transporter ATP-binding protein n=1 Tax=Succinispira mobilis TaxID=78120 RepID=UPI000366D8F9
MKNKRVINLKNINKQYVLPTMVLNTLIDINLEIYEGEFAAIMGPSGSGKSTLMNILGCLDRPTTGEYYLYDREVAQLSDDELAEVRNKKIGFVFQSFNLLPRMSALENVALPLVYANISSKERREKAISMLDKVGLQDRMQHKPNELSGGQRQRVAIARALINNPAIIMADEPTGNLDSKSSEDIMEIFAQLNEQGKTIIVVTHEQEIALKTKRIITVRDGRIV